MIGFVTLGSHDKQRAAGFYDTVLGERGAKRLPVDHDRLLFWEAGDNMLCVGDPQNGDPATVGNGVMVALRAASRGQVDKLHAMALELGASDEGAPGERGSDFYGAYFRDLDGNKLVFSAAKPAEPHAGAITIF